MAYVKICGITNLTDAKLAQKLGARFLGFVFYKKSPRFISPRKAKLIIKKLNPEIKPVGVFVNESLISVRKIAQKSGIRILQLHGNESPRYCEHLLREGFKVIKAFRIKDGSSLRSILKYKVSAFLFDAYSKKSFGGTGKSFDWKLLKRKFDVPIFLSGGINIGNVNKAIKTVKPYAIDASSSLEKYPGKKDSRLLRRFFRTLLAQE